jgi:hypothetical protein
VLHRDLLYRMSIWAPGSWVSILPAAIFLFLRGLHFPAGYSLAGCSEVKKPGEWRSLTPNDAADIGRYLISALSELEKADGAEVPSIGPVADCALLSPTRRFVWL